ALINKLRRDLLSIEAALIRIARRREYSLASYRESPFCTSKRKFESQRSPPNENSRAEFGYVVVCGVLQQCGGLCGRQSDSVRQSTLASHVGSAWRSGVHTHGQRYRFCGRGNC